MNSLFELYSKANQNKTSTLLPTGKQEYVKQAQAAQLGATGALIGEAQLPGNRGAVAKLKIQSKLTPLTSDLQPGTPVKYTRLIASNLAVKTNTLATRTSALNAGGFQADIATYLDRIFMQEALGTSRLAVSSTNLISTAAQSKPVATGTSST